MDNKSDIVKRIESALNEIRPYLEADGGGIEFIGLTENMEVKVKLLGTCVSCDISMQTLKNGVESTVKKAVPEVVKVIDCTGQ